MGFDEPDDDIDAFFFQAMGFLKHLISFADSRAVAEVDLQLAPLRAADHLQECLSAIFSHGDFFLQAN